MTNMKISEIVYSEKRKISLGAYENQDVYISCKAVTENSDEVDEIYGNLKQIVTKHLNSRVEEILATIIPHKNTIECVKQPDTNFAKVESNLNLADKVRAALIKFGSQAGKDELIKLFGRFGASGMSGIKEADYNDILEYINNFNILPPQTPKHTEVVLMDKPLAQPKKVDAPAVKPVVIQPPLAITDNPKFNELLAALNAFKKTTSSDAARALLARFGAEQPSDIDPDQYTDVLMEIVRES